MGPLQFVQGLAGAPHQALAAGLVQRFVVSKLLRQLIEQLLLVRGQRNRHLPQAAAQERLKGLPATLKIAEAALSLQLQALLQRPQPGLQRQC